MARQPKVITSPHPSTTLAALPPRFTCLWLEDLPSWAILRRKPDLAGRAILVVSGERVIGANRSARDGGVRPGDALGRARGLMPAAVTYRYDREAVLSLWRAALETMNAVTPWIEILEPGTAFLGGLNSEDAADLAQRLGARLGLAASRDSARLAAYSAPEGGVRDARDDLALLESLPTASLLNLGFEPKVLRRLELLGFTTVGTLKTLSVKHLEAQFGKTTGRALHRVAHGEDRKAVTVYEPPRTVEARIEFDDLSPSDLEALRPALHLVAERAVGRLAGLQCGWVGIVLEGGERTSLRRFLPNATNDLKTISRVALALLERTVGEGEIGAISVTLGELTRPTYVQDSLFALLERPRVREAIRRVHSRHPGSLGRLETHRPRAMLPELRSRFVPLTGDEAAKKGRG